MKIPFVDLKAQYKTLKPEIDAAIQGVIDQTAFIGGPRIEAFEQAFANAQGVKHCIGVANGTDAIFIALKMMGVGPGDEVITAANSWISSSETISQTGATPVFVDINQYSNLDTAKVEQAINSRTKAIIPVHLYGQPSDADLIADLAAAHNIQVIEDSAQAHLAKLHGKPVGSYGKCATFSFFPGKNLGAYGDAGAIVTNDDEFAMKCKLYARHGALKKHEHVMEGINSRLDGMQAAILSAKLPHLQDWTTARQKIASVYDDKLKNLEWLHLPKRAPNRSHVFHLYVVRTDRRDELQAHLNTHGVSTGIHYPRALPTLPAYDYLNLDPANFERAIKYQDQILSLPIFPEMTSEQIEHVVSSIESFE